MYADGGGLYLQVTSSGAKSWIFRFSLRGRAREMGLGPLNAVTLAQARVQAEECRRQRHQDIDPIEARNAVREQAKLEAARAITFTDAAAAFIKAHQVSWRNAKHASQWAGTLKTYVEPVFGSLSVQAIDTGLVMKALEPIWAVKPETASRLRGRIESILDWSKVRGHRGGENPARWKGHLDQLLPKKSKVRDVAHHPALPYHETAPFMAALRDREGVAARALEFLILTAARTSDIIGNNRDDVSPMMWKHVDLARRVWTVPKTKNGSEHLVPLSNAACNVLKGVAKPSRQSDDLVFPSNDGLPLSNMTMAAVLKRMNAERKRDGKSPYVDPKSSGREVVPHGFRSTFRDWAAERTNFPSEVVEMGLAHAIGDKVEAAYRRGDLFEKRRRLMDAWAEYCAKTTKSGATVIALPGKKSRARQ